MHIFLGADRVNIFAIVGADRVLDVPHHNLAVQEQCGEAVALTVKAGVKRAKTQFRLCNHNRPWVNI